MAINRREAIKSIALTPLVVSGAKNPIPAKGSAVSDRIALSVVRLFNTIELHYKLKFERYGTVDELFDTTNVSWFINRNKAQQHDLDDEFFSALRLGQEEVVSGWQMWISKSDDSMEYGLTLARTDGPVIEENENSIFVSDDQGIIFVGDIRVDRTAPKHYRAADSVPMAIPLDQSSLMSRPSKFGAAFRSFAFAGMRSPQGCGIPKCGCACSCICDTGQCYCYNIGCRSCAWCCTGYCTDCIVLCNHSCACCD